MVTDAGGAAAAAAAGRRDGYRSAHVGVPVPVIAAVDKVAAPLVPHYSNSAI